MYICIFNYVSVCGCAHVCASAWVEQSLWFLLGTGITGGELLSCGCWTWTLVPWKSIICSYLLNYPSSPSTISFNPYFKRLKACCSSCCLQSSFPGRLHLQVGCLWELRLLSFGILNAFPKRSIPCPSMLTLILSPPTPSCVAIPCVSPSTSFNKAGSVFTF